MWKCLCLVSLLLAVALVNSIGYPDLASKSRYNDHRGHMKLCSKANYIPDAAFLMIRHTASILKVGEYDNVTIMSGIQTLVEAQTESSARSDLLQTFMQWDKNEARLTPGVLQIGKLDLQAFVLRLKAMLPRLYPSPYDSKKNPMTAIPDKEDDQDRSVHSAQIFLQALFGRDFAKEDIPTCGDTDLTFMMEYARDEVDPHREIYKLNFKKQMKEFIENNHGIKQVRKNLAKKLMLTEEDTTYERVKAIFENCRALRLACDNNNVQPCPLLSPTDAEAMVQADIMFWQWFTDVDANHFNGQMGCGIAEHLLSFFEREIPVNPMIFAKRSNVLIVAKIFGVLHGKEKKSNISKIIPSMANFLAVVYKSSFKEEFPLVSFYFNEHLTFIILKDGTGCDVCRLDAIIELLKAYIAQHDCAQLKCDSKQPDKPCYSPPNW